MGKGGVCYVKQEVGGTIWRERSGLCYVGGGGKREVGIGLVVV